MMRPVVMLVGIVAGIAFSSALAADPELDPATGLKMTGDWQLVRNNCVACHSAKLITQQRGTEAHWLSLIRWMQAKQNLWKFEPETEKNDHRLPGRELSAAGGSPQGGEYRRT